MKIVRKMKPVSTTKKATSYVSPPKKLIELVSAAHFSQIATYCSSPFSSRTVYSLSGVAFLSSLQKQVNAPCLETTSLKLADVGSMFSHYYISL